MSRKTAYVIGLDGGGTKTKAQLADLNGTVAAETQGGPSNFQIIGVEESAKNILDLIETCCHTVGCNISEIGSLVAGLAGAGRTADQHVIEAGLHDAAQKRGIYLNDLKIESDARIALEGAFLGKKGIVLICGTGSIAFARTDKGRIIRAGGWGRLVGDEGSGHDIGREALRSVARMIDGRGKTTRIAGQLASRFGLKSQEEIIRAVYRDNFDVSSVAPLVLNAARQGDPVAREILETAAHDLVELVQAVLNGMKKTQRFSRQKIPVALSGGLLGSKNAYSTKVRNLLRRFLPNTSVQEPIAQPVRGAVLMAMARAKGG